MPVTAGPLQPGGQISADRADDDRCLSRLSNSLIGPDLQPQSKTSILAKFAMHHISGEFHRLKTKTGLS